MLQLSSANSSIDQQSPMGRVEKVWLNGSTICIKGWAIGSDRRPPKGFSVSIDSNPIHDIRATKKKRPDVAQAFPDVGPEVGFRIDFSVFDFPIDSPSNHTLTVTPLGETASLPTIKGFRHAEALADCTASLPYISNGPTMPEEAVQLLNASLRKAKCYLEYGTGGSSVSAVMARVPNIVCVESDLSWLRAVAYKLRSLGVAESALHFSYQNIGPTGRWGVPVSNDEFKRWHLYPLGFWTDPERSLSPDLVLIDGRFRVACFMASLIFAKPGSVILFDDYVNRDFYHSIETFVKPEQVAGRMALFRVPKRINANAAWAHLTAATTDYR